MQGAESLLNAIKEAAGIVLNLDPPTAILFSDDGDGLSSAYLMSILMEHLEKDYELICIDKPYPEVVNEVGKEFKSTVILDLGGPIHTIVAEDIRDRILVIDHHQEVVGPPREFKYLNPTLYGEEVSKGISTSVLVYYIVKELLEDYIRYSPYALLGLGESPDAPSGLSLRMIVEAGLKGFIGRTRKSYRVKIHDVEKEYRSLFKEITLVSTMGYYDDSPLDILAWMRYGGYEDIRRSLEKYRVRRREMFNEMFSLIEEEGLYVKRFIQWVEDSKNIFYNVSTRVFDTFLSTLSRNVRYYDVRKYLLGIEIRNPYIPGFRQLRRDWLNIPVRVSMKLEYKIKIGAAQPVNALVEAAAYANGGLGYGYRHMGVALIPSDNLNDFLNTLDGMLSG